MVIRHPVSCGETRCAPDLAICRANRVQMPSHHQSTEQRRNKWKIRETSATFLLNKIRLAKLNVTKWSCKAHEMSHRSSLISVVSKFSKDCLIMHT